MNNKMNNKMNLLTSLAKEINFQKGVDIYVR